MLDDHMYSASGFAVAEYRPEPSRLRLNRHKAARLLDLPWGIGGKAALDVCRRRSQLSGKSSRRDKKSGDINEGRESHVAGKRWQSREDATAQVASSTIHPLTCPPPEYLWRGKEGKRNLPWERDPIVMRGVWIAIRGDGTIVVIAGGCARCGMTQ
jgi:hypothetical protein